MNLTNSQKKVAAMAIIIVFAAIELVFLATLIFTIVSGESPPEQAISFIFVMGIFAVPIWWGIRLRKASSIATWGDHAGGSIAPVVDGDSIVSVETKVKFPEYRRMVFYNTYTHPMVIFFHFIGISFITFYLVLGSANWFTWFAAIFILYLPIAIHRGAKSGYASSKTVHETLSYTFSRQGVTAVGKTVNFSIQWQSLFKICETKSWILLYTNKQNVMLIPKSAFTSEQDVTRFREMIPAEVVREGINS